MSWGFGQKRKRTLSIRVAGAGRAGRHGLRELVGDGKVIRCSAVSLEELLHQECQSGQGDDGGGTTTAIKETWPTNPTSPPCSMPRRNSTAGSTWRDSWAGSRSA